jgi:hypothetical protein
MLNILNEALTPMKTKILMTLATIFLLAGMLPLAACESDYYGPYGPGYGYGYGYSPTYAYLGDYDEHHRWRDRDWWVDNHHSWVHEHHPEWVQRERREEHEEHERHEHGH